MKRDGFMKTGTKVNVHEVRGLSQVKYEAEVHYHGPGVYGYGTRVSLRDVGAKPNERGEMNVWEVTISAVTVA